jgi:hypothetical protein
MTLLNKFHHLIVWSILYTLLITLTHLGALEYETINWDESTFILMASDVAKGHLPYVNLFDNKPPGMFLILSGVFKLFGESIWAVRLLGDFSIFIQAIFTYLIAIRFNKSLTAGLLVAAMIAMTSAYFWQYTSTELPATALLVIALWIMVYKFERTQLSAFMVGILMSSASMIRLNLAFPCLAVAIYYFLPFVRLAHYAPRYSVIYFGLGFIIPIVILIFTYYYSGYLDLFILCVFKVPFYYASEQINFFQAFKEQIWNWHNLIKLQPMLFIPFSLMLVISLIVSTSQFCSISRVKSRFNEDKMKDAILLLLFFFSVAISVLKSGAAYSHYLLQLLPFMVLIITLSISFLPSQVITNIQHFFCIVSISYSCYISYPSFVRVIKNSNEIVNSYKMRNIAIQIINDRQLNDEVWPLMDHLVLWYLKQDPLSPAGTHPSNLTRNAIIEPLIKAGYVPANEVERVMNRRPRYIISRKNGVEYFSEKQNKELSDLLTSKYDEWLKIDKTFVYKLKANYDTK